MRLPTALFLAFLPLATFGQGLLFKDVPREGHCYRTELRASGDYTVDFQGDTLVLLAMRQGGLTLPMRLHQQEVIGFQATTGTRNASGALPFHGEVDSNRTQITLNGVEQPRQPEPLDAAHSICGRFLGDSVAIDTMQGRPADSALEGPVREALLQLLRPVAFPQRPLSLGDTFTQTEPLSIPVPDLPDLPDLHFEIVATYRLEAVDSLQARFAMRLSYRNPGSDSAHATISGDGTGTFLYDRRAQVVTATEVHSTAAFAIDGGPVAVRIAATIAGQAKTRVFPAP